MREKWQRLRRQPSQRLQKRQRPGAAQEVGQREPVRMLWPWTALAARPLRCTCAPACTWAVQLHMWCKRVLVLASCMHLAWPGTLSA